MSVWSVITIVVLTIALFTVVILSLVKTYKNYNLAAQQRFIPFTSSVDPTTGVATPFTDASGNPQISCPAGSKINIVGAFINAFDPYNECVNNQTDVLPILPFVCDPTAQSQTSCSHDSDCPNSVAFYCNKTSNKCQLYNQGKDSDVTCPQGTQLVNVGSGAYCVDPNACGYNIDLTKKGVGIPNPYCAPFNGNAKCAIRDASGSVASKCDGLMTCPDISINDFGDLPCTGDNMKPQVCITGYDQNGNPLWAQGSNTRTGYCGLPYMPGYPGNVPPGSSTDTPDPANSNLGYVMHGIYTCIPN